MAHKAIAWTLGEDSSVTRLYAAELDLEKHLENWAERDPEIVGGDVLLIGRQKYTDFGGIVDLLGIGPNGELVIIELKRDRTLRETVAQALEYAAWASHLPYDRILEIATEYHGSSDKFAERFRQTFGTDVPDTVNQSQRIVLVAPEVTEGVRAVVEYLAETYGVPINALSFSLFNVGGSAVLVREVVLSDEEVISRPEHGSKTVPTVEKLLQQADAAGLGEITRYLWSLHSNFPPPQRYMNGWGFRLKSGKLYRSLFTVFPTGSKQAKDRVVISMCADNLAELFGHPSSDCQQFIQRIAESIGHPEASPWVGWDRFSLQNVDAAKQFVGDLRKFTGLELPEEDEAEER
jgi:hypothetical protein